MGHLKAALFLSLMAVCLARPGPSVGDPSQCQTPTKPGRCLANFQIYTYFPQRNTCVQITYGGCGATANFFETKKKCQNTCVH